MMILSKYIQIALTNQNIETIEVNIIIDDNVLYVSNEQTGNKIKFIFRDGK